jgi:hypothetical protein
MKPAARLSRSTPPVLLTWGNGYTVTTYRPGWRACLAAARVALRSPCAAVVSNRRVLFASSNEARTLAETVCAR